MENSNDKDHSEDSQEKDIFDGLEYFNPKKEYCHIENVSRLALDLPEKGAKMMFHSFLDRYEDEKRQMRTRDSIDMHGRSPLHWTVGANHAPGYEALIARGADINVKSRPEEFTPLMVACRPEGKVHTVKNLIDKKADVNAKAKNCITAFHIATASGSRDSMRLLVLCGADPFVILSDGRTALDLAKNDQMKSLVYSCYRSAAIYKEKFDASCANCDNKNVKLDRCGKCYITFYCQRRCQLNHWKQGHQEECKGCLTAVISGERPKTYVKRKGEAAKRRHDQAFIVQLTVEEVRAEQEIIVVNNERNLRAKIQHENLEDILHHIRSFQLETLYFWAKYSDPTEFQLFVYHAKPLPIDKVSL